MPNTNKHKTNCHGCTTKPKTGSVIAYNNAAQMTTYLLPNFATIKPAKGSDNNNPTGSPNKIEPNPALLNCSFD